MVVFCQNMIMRLEDTTQYRSVVGMLQYCVLTRLKISYSANKLSQFLHAPTSTHWQETKMVLCYLKGTLSHELMLHKYEVLRN